MPQLSAPEARRSTTQRADRLAARHLKDGEGARRWLFDQTEFLVPKVNNLKK